MLLFYPQRSLAFFPILSHQPYEKYILSVLSKNCVPSCFTKSTWPILLQKLTLSVHVGIRARTCSILSLPVGPSTLWHLLPAAHSHTLLSAATPTAVVTVNTLYPRKVTGELPYYSRLHHHHHMKRSSGLCTKGALCSPNSYTISLDNCFVICFI